MSRPRGNKTSNAAREQRRSSVAEVLQENPSIVQADLAEVTGVSLATVKRDLAELRARFSLITDERYEEFKKTQLAVFELIERNLVEGSVTPEVAREWRGIRSEISQLLGLNAPKTAVVGHVSAGVDLKFKKATSGLTADQLDSVYAFAANLPRERTVRRDASWFPKPEPMLLEGSDD